VAGGPASDAECGERGVGEESVRHSVLAVCNALT
jgi:hypothetical protein